MKIKNFITEFAKINVILMKPCQSPVTYEGQFLFLNGTTLLQQKKTTPNSLPNLKPPFFNQ
jgi:hypothetical protein